MARKIKRAYARYSESFKAEAVRGIYKLCNHCRCGAFPLTLMVTGHVLHNLSNLLNMTILGLLADINQLYFNKNKHKKRAFRRKPFFYILVRKERLELSRLTALVPKTSASTNSATLAF